MSNTDPVRAVSGTLQAGRRQPKRSKPSLAKLQRKAQAFVLAMQSYGYGAVRGEVVPSPNDLLELLGICDSAAACVEMLRQEVLPSAGVPEEDPEWASRNRDSL